MNFIKTKKMLMILMLAVHASLHCAAEQLEQRNLWRRTKDFAAEHSFAAGTVVVAGAYELVANSLDLPTIIDTIKADLITGTEEQGENIGLAYHLLHGARIDSYARLLTTIIKFLAKKTGLYSKQNALHNKQVAGQAITESLLCRLIFFGPILEELLMTYSTRYVLGNDLARLIAPIVFGLAHTQYSLFCMMLCSLNSFLGHHSLHTRPEYPYAPIISHMLNNAIVVYFFLNQTKR